MNTDKTPPHIKLDERNHVEEPFLAQLEWLGWDVLRLEQKQSPRDSYRENFAEVVLLPRLRESLKKINPWLEEDQVDEVVKRITALPGTGLLENNQQVLKLFLETVLPKLPSSEHNSQPHHHPATIASRTSTETISNPLN